MNVINKRIVIVSGPQGCGKTRFAEQLSDVFGCERIVDEWDGESELQPGDLALTNAESFRAPANATTVTVAG